MTAVPFLTSIRGLLPGAQPPGTARWKGVLAVAGFFALPFLFYWKLFAWDVSERKIYRGDFLNQHYVWKSYVLGRVKDGEIPLWNPHVLGGVPIHANPQAGLFYPPNYLLLPFHQGGTLRYEALEAFQLLHLTLAGVGTWLLLRLLGLGVGAAWVGAIVSMFTGFFTTPGHHALVLSASWIPLVLFLVGRSMKATDRRSVGLLALGLSAMLLAGHPQPAYEGVLLASAWAWFLGGGFRFVRRFAPALGLAASIASVQFLPTMLLARESYRASSGYEFATSFEFSPLWLWAALVPRAQVVPPGELASAPLHVYVGIGSLLLAAVGLTWSSLRSRWFFAAVAVVAVFLSVGQDSILFDVAYLGFPGFGRFRIPFRWLGLYALAMSVLVGLGVQCLLAGGHRLRRRLRPLLGAAAVLLVLMGAWSAYLYTLLLKGADGAGLVPVDRLVAGTNWALMLLALNAIFLLAYRWQPRARWPVWLVGGLLVIDLGSFVKDRGMRPYRTLVRSGERQVTRLVAAQAFPARYASGRRFENYAMLHGTESVGGHFSMLDGRYGELLDASSRSLNILSLLNVAFLARVPSNMKWCGSRVHSPMPLIDITPSISPLTLKAQQPREVHSLRLTWSWIGDAGSASVLANGHVFSFPARGPLEIRFSPPEIFQELTVRANNDSSGLRLEGIELNGISIAQTDDFLDVGGVHLNLHRVPRAYFVGACDSYVEGADRAAFDSLSCWTPAAAVPVAPCPVPSAGDGLQSVDITRYESETVELAVVAPRAGYVVLADTFHNGWDAEVDGRKMPIHRAHHAQRAVAVPPGEHIVRFVYRPRSLYTGAMIASVGLLMVLGLLAGFRGYGRSR